MELPRDRNGSFAPILIPKHERRFTGFDDRIIAMYARGMSVREIQAFLAFASAAHLAAYAGLAPVTRRSGSSIRGEHPSRHGNKVLKPTLFLSAFAALRDPISRAYYTRKIQQGKRHNQAPIALARRRCDVLFAMPRDRTFYQPKPKPPLTLDETHNPCPSSLTTGALRPRQCWTYGFPPFNTPSEMTPLGKYGLRRR